MNIRQELQSIIYRSGINSSRLFLVTDKWGSSHYVPLEGITSCVQNLKSAQQQKLIRHCRRLNNDPEALLEFFERLARVVVNRRL